MLGKLIKHEFIATTRYMLPLNLLVLVSIIFARIFIALKIANNTHEIVVMLMLFSFGALLVLSLAATYIYFIVRFYRNLFTDEGYLMFTLPVKAWHHIVAKGLASFVWQAVNYTLVFGSIPFLVLGSIISSSEWQEFLEVWNVIMASYRVEFGHSIGLFIFLLIITMIVALVSTILRIYTAIAIGQLVNKHKIIGAVAAHFCIGIITSIISSVLSALTSIQSMNSLVVGDSAVKFMQSTYSSMIYSIVISIIFSIAYYAIAQYLMSRKLNLD